MWCVYIIETKDGKFYTGITKDIERRIKEHIKGKGSRFMRVFGFKKLLYQYQLLTRAEALKREVQIKSWPKIKKLALIQGRIQ